MDLEKMLEKLNQELGEAKEIPSKHPGKEISAEKRSEIVKKAKKGEDIGKKGKKFKEVAKKAAEHYGSKESGKRIAASAMWKNIKKKG